MDAWGRPSFARAMIEVSSMNDLKEKIVVGTPKLHGDELIRTEIKVEYEWKPPRCSLCKVFGHVDASCLKNITKPTKEKTQIHDNDGFQQVKKKKKGFNVGPPKKQLLEYRPKPQQTKSIATSSGTCKNPIEVLEPAGALQESKK